MAQQKDSLFNRFNRAVFVLSKPRNSVRSPIDTNKDDTATFYEGIPTLDAIKGDLSSKTVLVTGANTGIGFHTAKNCLCRGASRVILACRNADKGELAASQIRKEATEKGWSGVVEVVRLDLEDLIGVKLVGSELANNLDRLDVLINNAGIMDVVPNSKEVFKFTKNGYERMFGTNHLGHFLLFQCLLPVLLKTPGIPRVVVVSSWANWHAPTPGIDFESLTGEKKGFQPTNLYGQSKVANILFAKKASDLYGDKIIVNSCHPGVVETELFRPSKYTFAWFASKVISLNKMLYTNILTPEQGALTSLYLAMSPDVVEKGYHGRYFIPFGAVSTDFHPKCTDADLADRLWSFSEEACAKI